MTKTKLSLAERKQLLEETKQKLRLLQEARTIKRIEELDIEACERLGRQLQSEYKELNHSSTVETVSVNKSSSLLETPD